MKLLILHLSDIHIKSTSDIILTRADCIGDAMSDIDSGIEGCIVVISGDIAYSGQVEQYDLAEKFLNRLKSRLVETVHVPDIHIVLVPGNHDCDFSTQNQIRDLMIEQIAKGTVGVISSELATLNLTVQKNYWEFATRITGIPLGAKPNDQLYHLEQIRIGSKTISFNAYNTAWMSQIHEIQGSLHFPCEAIPEEDLTSDLVVSVFHHPYNWLESINARVFRNSVERNSDLILTGHEHTASQYVKTNRISGETNEYVEGAVLQDSRTPDSGFNAILIDLDLEKQKFFSAMWNGNLYATEVINTTWSDFQRNKNRTRNEFVISTLWADYLDDPGAGFTNSRKEHLNLDDIFVEPNFRELTRVDNVNQAVQLPIRGDQFWGKVGSPQKTENKAR